MTLAYDLTIMEVLIIILILSIIIGTLSMNIVYLVWCQLTKEALSDVPNEQMKCMSQIAKTICMF